MSIDESGFLSAEIDQYREEIRQRHTEFFALVERAVRCCHSTKSKFQVHTDDGQEIFATGLFLKLLADAEAAIMLLERGMVSQARSLLRVGIECSINLAKICECYEFVHAFAVVAERERLKLLKGIKDDEKAGYETLRAELTDALIQEIEATVSGKPKSNIRKWADDVNMTPIYAGLYRMFSAHVHSGPGSLSKFFIIDAAGKIAGIHWGPDLKYDLRPELVEVARLLITGLALVNQLFKVDVEQEANPIFEEYKRLGALVAAEKGPFQ